MAETIGQRVKRLRLALGMSQRDLAAPGVSYAYISRLEADTRKPSVKALRQIANTLGVSVEYLETGRRPPWEEGVEEAGVDPGSLTKEEIGTIRAAAADAAREAARRTAEGVKRERNAREIETLRKRIEELGG